MEAIELSLNFLVQFVMLYKVIFTIESVDEILSVTNQTKLDWQYFRVYYLLFNVFTGLILFQKPEGRQKQQKAIVKRNKTKCNVLQYLLLLHYCMLLCD